jgi:hypothetical protein
LATSALGCYGSSWNQTPALDAIAGSGLVWDRCIAASDDSPAFLQEIMNSEHAGEAQIMSGRSWAEFWRQRGSVELLTDTPSIDGLSQTCFDRISTLQFDRSKSSDSPVAEIEQSQLGQLFAAAIERDNEDEPWSVLWLHSGFLARCWDAPRDLFSSDEVDDINAPPSEDVELLEAEPDSNPKILEIPPPIFDAVVPPQIKLDHQAHPDLVNSWMRTYGCQVRLLDLLIEVLLGSLGAQDPYVVIIGTSGFRLGQGGWIGHRPDRLRSPDVHLPMIVSHNGPLRIPHVTSSAELSSVLGTLGRGEPLFPPSSWSKAGTDSRVETRSEQSQFAVTTAGWFFVRDNDSSEHLFLKPDDVDDFNDVGRLRNDVVEELSGSKK